MSMKSMFCVIVILAFLMYYQTNPVFTIVIIVVGLGIYIFYKSKVSESGSGISGFLSGRSPYDETRNIDDLVSLIMLQQLVTSSLDDRSPSQKNHDPKQTQKNRIASLQNEILDLFEPE